jgi:malate synthase
MIYRLNSGADVTMEDFEDSLSPTWHNLIQGQKNLIDAVDWDIAVEKDGKQIKLNDTVATLMIRPRGLHLDEKHVLLEGKPIPASLFDFGLYVYHNARELVDQGSTPAFYLPKMESHFETMIWNDIFAKAQHDLGIPYGTFRATVLIETLPAAFEMKEILYKLKDHVSGLNCGRWDYIFSYVKKLNHHADKILPDRDQVTMLQPFLQSYVDLLVQTCHQHGAYAMGGMAAQIPLKDPKANELAMAAVRADKEREVKAGHDGTWVAHPGLVPIARDIFEKGLAGKDNQLDNLREEVNVTAEDLVKLPYGSRTYGTFKNNIRIGVEYLAAWLSGNGCVALDGKMEDAATAEISKAQLWQQVKHKVKLDTGQTAGPELYCKAAVDVLSDIYRKIGGEQYAALNYVEADSLFSRMILDPHFEDFLTIPAYEQLIQEEK